MTLGMAIEWSWTLFNAIGIVAAGLVFRRAWQRRSAAKILGLSSAHMLVGNRNLREEGTKFVIHLCGIFIGTYALGQPDNDAEASALAVILTWLLVLMMFLLALSSILNLIDDYRLARMMDQQQRERERAVAASDVPST